MELSVPEHIEVTARICISLILTYILTLGYYPQAVPVTQNTTIASIASAFTMVLPTLMFSIGGAVFPGMVTATCVALLFATLLLAVAASGGVNAYVVVYFLVALLLAGLRFTKAGTMSAVLLMLTSLNTMGLSRVAANEGLGFVGSLWTEKGVDNPNAIFRNTLIGESILHYFSLAFCLQHSTYQSLLQTLIFNTISNLCFGIQACVGWHSVYALLG